LYIDPLSCGDVSDPMGQVQLSKAWQSRSRPALRKPRSRLPAALWLYHAAEPSAYQDAGVSGIQCRRRWGHLFDQRRRLASAIARLAPSVEVGEHLVEREDVGKHVLFEGSFDSHIGMARRARLGSQPSNRSSLGTCIRIQSGFASGSNTSFQHPGWMLASRAHPRSSTFDHQL